MSGDVWERLDVLMVAASAAIRELGHTMERVTLILTEAVKDWEQSDE